MLEKACLNRSSNNKEGKQQGLPIFIQLCRNWASLKDQKNLITWFPVMLNQIIT